MRRPAYDASGESSDSERRAETSAAVVGFGTVVPYEDAPVAAVAIERSALLSDVSRRLYPARSLRIEFAQLLKVEVFFFRQERDAHLRRHAHHTILWLMFLSRLQRLIVVTKTYSTARRLWRAIDKDIFAG